MKTLKTGWRWIVGVISITLLMALLFVNYQSSQTGKTQSPQIAAILPLTGSAAQIGTWQRRGLDLAISSMNQQGGYQGEPFSIVYEDSQGDPKTGVSALQKILTNSKPPVVFSSITSVASATLPILKQNNIVSMLLAVSLPGITERSEWAFRCNLGSDDEAKAMAAYLAKTDMRRVAVAYINDEFGVGATKVFQQAAKNNNFQVTIAEAYNQDSSDFRSLITKLQSSNSDAIYVIGYVRASILLIKQLRELGVKAPILGNMALSVPSFLKLGGEALDGAVFTVTLFDPQGQRPELQSFVDAYRSRYQEEPTFFSAFAYDAMMMISTAANQQEFSAEGIKEGLLNIRDYPGVLGSLTVQPNRDIKFPTQIVKNENGVLVPVGKGNEVS